MQEKGWYLVLRQRCQTVPHRGGDLPLAKAIEIATAHGVPLIVDGAAQLPPVENLWKFTQMAAVAPICSGGKDLRGPQPTRMAVGPRSLSQTCVSTVAPTTVLAAR